ncbi:hypothetical protein K2Q16_04420 [Patescibacteria group bacterium]|nr:hypothetical protein [Patescibacteria group bacterium]
MEVQISRYEQPGDFKGMWVVSCRLLGQELYLHQDGCWRETTMRNDGAWTGYHQSEIEARSCLARVDPASHDDNVYFFSKLLSLQAEAKQSTIPTIREAAEVLSILIVAVKRGEDFVTPLADSARVVGINLNLISATSKRR